MRVVKETGRNGSLNILILGSDESLVEDREEFLCGDSHQSD